MIGPQTASCARLTHASAWTARPPLLVVVARARDWDDHINWFLERGDTAEALRLAVRHAPALREHRVVDLAELEIGALLRAGRAQEAAGVCAAHLGASIERWERWLHAFSASGHLMWLAPHVPLANPQLPSEAYESALIAAIALAPPPPLPPPPPPTTTTSDHAAPLHEGCRGDRVASRQWYRGAARLLGEDRRGSQRAG